MWSSKFSKFSSTSALTLALILLLALTWVLSFRPVRLTIGDYYFGQGKFNQAAKWYEKLVRKERLNVDQGRSSLLLYEKDLSKLKSALLPQMEKNLLKVSQLFGFQQAKDLKSLLADPTLFQKHTDRFVGDRLKEKLQKAKEELINFEKIVGTYKNLYEKKRHGEKFDY